MMKMIEPNGPGPGEVIKLWLCIFSSCLTTEYLTIVFPQILGHHFLGAKHQALSQYKKAEGSTAERTSLFLGGSNHGGREDEVWDHRR